MADVNRGNRPLSPFLTSYQQPFNAILSILHRITGAGMTLGAILIVWWFLGAAGGQENFRFVNALLSSWIGGLVLLICLAMLWFHFFNGVRHLMWDTGRGYEKPMVRKSGIVMLAAAGSMTLITWIASYF